MRLVFLDRDGVINRFPGKGLYVTRPEQLKVLSNALKGLKLLNRPDTRVMIVSNQGCVSRGMITKKALTEMTRGLLRDIRRAGGKIDRVLYCYHQTSDHCDCKKPKTALLQKGLRSMKKKPDVMYFVGDSEEDMVAGQHFGCQTVLALSGRSKKKDVSHLSVQPTIVKQNLYEAAQWILRKKS